jgi:hypothetical protein
MTKAKFLKMNRAGDGSARCNQPSSANLSDKTDN